MKESDDTEHAQRVAQVKAAAEFFGARHPALQRLAAEDSQRVNSWWRVDVIAGIVALASTSLLAVIGAVTVAIEFYHMLAKQPFVDAVFIVLVVSALLSSAIFVIARPSNH